MEVSVVRIGSEEHGRLGDRLTAVQGNQNPGPRPQSRCRVVGRNVMTWVPVCFAGVTSQVGVAPQREMTESYRECLLTAAKQGASLLEAAEFGVGTRKEVMVGTKMVMKDFGLHWKPADVARCARSAVGAAAPELPPGFKVVFAVPPDHFDEWSHVMRF